MGFAIAKTIALSFIDAIISFVTISGADTPINISAPIKASFSLPFFSFGLVSSANFSINQLLSLSPLLSMPSLPQTIISPAPIAISIFVIADPAAPGPFTTILTSFHSFLTNFSELISPATVTIAVPC